MKKIKFLPSVLMLVACIAILGVGVFAIAPTQNTISGKITINASSAPVEIQMIISGMSGEDVVTDPVTVRGGTTFDVGELIFNTDNANLLSDVEDIVISFKITNLAEVTTNQGLADKALGAFFAYQDTAIPEDSLALAQHVAISDTITNGATGEDLITYASVQMSPYTSILPTMSGQEATPAEMKITLTMETFEAVSQKPINYQLFIEPYVAETTSDGLVKLPIVQEAQAANLSSVAPLSAVALEGEDVELFTEITSTTIANKSTVTMVSIPEQVTTIGANAFMDSFYLKSVNLPAGLQSIGNAAFYNCVSLEMLDMQHCTNITAMPRAILCVYLYGVYDTAPGSYGFVPKSSSLKKVYLPTSIESIGDSAFYGCENLEYINIYECKNLKVIEESAFTAVGQGTINIKLPSSVTSISALFGYYYISDSYTNQYTRGSFNVIDLSECINVESLVTYVDINGNINGVFSNIDCKKIILPESITTIGDYAFCTSTIDNLQFETSNLETIGHSAFKGAIISDLKIKSDKLTIIGNECFAGSTITNFECKNLITMGDSAFYNVELESLIFSDKITSIGTGCFTGATINHIYFGDILPTSIISLNGLTFSNVYVPSIDVWFTVMKNTTDYHGFNYSLYVNDILLTKLTTVGSATEIPSGAFFGCQSLQEADLSACLNLTEIKHEAFVLCTNLKKVYIPANVTKIAGTTTFWQFSSCHADLVINCEVTEENVPEGWEEEWNYNEGEEVPVNWGVANPNR